MGGCCYCFGVFIASHVALVVQHIAGSYAGFTITHGVNKQSKMEKAKFQIYSEIWLFRIIPK
ncbi:MAG: hypothetical protein ACI88A_000693 [Paraglaciecola sp.]|jgi:hypothetical protein